MHLVRRQRVIRYVAILWFREIMKFMPNNTRAKLCGDKIHQRTLKDASVVSDFNIFHTPYPLPAPKSHPSDLSLFANISNN